MKKLIICLIILSANSSWAGNEQADLFDVSKLKVKCTEGAANNSKVIAFTHLVGNDNFIIYLDKDKGITSYKITFAKLNNSTNITSGGNAPAIEINTTKCDIGMFFESISLEENLLSCRWNKVSHHRFDPPDKTFYVSDGRLSTKSNLKSKRYKTGYHQAALGNQIYYLPLNLEEEPNVSCEVRTFYGE